MADRDVEVDIIANDKTARATDSAARNFDGLDRRVKRSSKDRNVQLERDTRKSMNIFQSLFGGLVKEGQKAGMLAGDQTIDSFGAAFRALPPEAKLGLAAGIAGAGIIAAPIIVSTVNAAILAGLGAGGLAIGIALAAKDPAVAAAYSNLGNRISTQLKEDVQPFKGELIASAGIFGKSFDAVQPRIQRIFATLSTAIKPLAEGLGKGLENAFPGLERAVQASMPLLAELARQLPRIGQLVGDLFSAIADAGPGAAFTFKLILLSVEALITMITWLVQTMGPVANGVAALNDAAVALTKTLMGKGPENMTRQLATLSTTATSSTFTLNGLAVAEYNTAEAARAADAAFRSLFGELMSVDQANLAVKTGMANLTQTIKGNAKTLDENTAAGRANVGAILSQIQALDQKRQADIAAGNGTVEATNRANAAYASQVASLRRVLVQMGLTEAEVDNLIAKYEQIPRNIGTTITTTYRTNGTPQQGHSRYAPGTGDFAALDGWRPYTFAAARPGGGTFAAAAGGGSRTMAPYQIDSHVAVDVMLDGAPFRKVAARVTGEALRRQRWRDRVGTR